MTKENPDSSQRNIGDSVEDSMLKEAEGYRRIASRLFKERYALFKSKDIKFLDLYAGDFRPQIGLTSSSPLQILLPSDIFMTISYEDLFTNFVKIFIKDIKSGSFELGTGEEIPDRKTTKLKEFVGKNPNKQLPYKYFKYELKPEGNYEGRIIVKRYFEDFTFERSISEIWTASKSKKQ